MERKTINETSRDEAKTYAKGLLESKLSCIVENIQYIGGGYFGYVFKAWIDRAPYIVAIKACRVEGMCEQEANALIKLREDSLIKMPFVYFTQLKSQTTPIDFLCMEYIGGKTCYESFFQVFRSKKTKDIFANEITSALNHWHCITNDKFGLIEKPCYENWLDFYKPYAFDILESAKKMPASERLHKSIIDSMECAWGAFDYIFSEKVEVASLIHGDLNVMNIMVNKQLKATGIIDPLECRWADKEYDLFQLRNLTGNLFGLYEMYKEKYPVSEKCDIKTSFYALFHDVYCYVSSGQKVDFYFFPLVRRMNKELKKAGLRSC